MTYLADFYLLVHVCVFRGFYLEGLFQFSEGAISYTVPKNIFSFFMTLSYLGKFKNMREKYVSNASENIFDLRLKISNSSNKEKDVF